MRYDEQQQQQLVRLYAASLRLATTDRLTEAMRGDRAYDVVAVEEWLGVEASI